MGMVKMATTRSPGGEWAQASSVFGSTQKGSKIKNKSHFEFGSFEGKKQAIIELTKVANAGYSPSDDLIEPFNRGPNGVIPIDLDLIVRHQLIHRRWSERELAENLIECIALNTPKKTEQNKLLQIAQETASDELKKFLHYKF